MLSGDVIVVTGSGRGIGKSISEYLVHKGHQVVGLDLHTNDCGILQYECDLSDYKSTAKAVSSFLSEDVRITGLVNNAAIQLEKTIFETQQAELMKVFSVNVFSIFHLVQLLQAHFSNNCSIVNISSVHARATSAGLSAYAASKGAVSALTRSMALELGSRCNARVNSVCPGAVDTPMLRDGLVRFENAEAALEKLRAASPLGKIGRPLEIAKMVDFLLDNDRSSGITGQEFIVDCGVLARLASE